MDEQQLDNYIEGWDFVRMAKDARQDGNLIVAEMFGEQGARTMANIADRYGVSMRTARRDLKTLAAFTYHAV